jgi:predicted nucleotidyltransferase
MIDIKKAITTLADNNVEFVLIGGVALSLHSAAYITYDIDICFLRDRSNLDKLTEALRPFNPRLRGLPEDLPFVWDTSTLSNGTVFTLETTIGEIDLLAEVDGIGGYRQVLEFAEEWEVFGYRIKVLSIDGLIKAKEKAGREKDIPGLKILYALREANADEN